MLHATPMAEIAINPLSWLPPWFIDRSRRSHTAIIPIPPTVGTTVLMWLQHPRWHKPWDTAWTVGTQANSSSAPQWTKRGLVDHSSAFIAAQSFTDPTGPSSPPFLSRLAMLARPRNLESFRRGRTRPGQGTYPAGTAGIPGNFQDCGA